MDLIGALFPGLKAAYLTKRAQLAHAQRLYDAAKSTQYHPRRGDNRSGNAVMEHARDKVANWARNQEENHDLAVGILDDLTDRVVGTGIVVAPAIKDARGELLEDLNTTIARAFADWGRAPDVSGILPWGELQRLLFRSLMRDGDVLINHRMGLSGYDYASPVPYVIQGLESDYLPFELTQDTPEILHGVEMDRFGKVVAYHIYQRHPGEYMLPVMSRAALLENTDRVTADRISHLRVSRRLSQLRGISILHACMYRLQDLRDYEESERLAAKVAASFTAAITKAPDMPGTLHREIDGSGERNLTMEPAMIFDNLLPGESIQTIDSNRPSNALGDYRASMLKAASAGTGARYSTISRTWDSSYTAMRQETVSLQPTTSRLQEYFVSKGVRTVYENWLRLAEAAGVLDLSRADRMTVFDADYRGPAQQWLDPLDEVKADVESIKAGLKSRQQVHRERGVDTARVDAELEADTFQQQTEPGNGEDAETADDTDETEQPA